jgi:hypothetical protein
LSQIIFEDILEAIKKVPNANMIFCSSRMAGKSHIHQIFITAGWRFRAEQFNGKEKVQFT